MSLQIGDISSIATISPAQDQIASELGGEAIILNLTSGIYYGLNEVGARIWELIQQPCSFDDIYQKLVAEYDVEPDICKQDLTRILEDMKAACLIEVSDETSI